MPIPLSGEFEKTGNPIRPSNRYKLTADKPIFALGAKPFLLAEIFKIMILAILTKQIIKIRKFI